MASDEKLKALDAAISNIEKQFGKGSIMKLGESNVNLNVESIPTGSLSLDIALGLGGVPRGRVVEIYGPESSGKTTVALHMVAEVQKVLRALLMLNTLWTRFMQRISVSTLTIYIFHSRIAVSRHLRLPKRWCVPVR